jgi:hypothetical protein
MKKETSKRRAKSAGEDIFTRYDFSKAVRGKYAQRYRQGVSVTVFDPNEVAVKRGEGTKQTFVALEPDVVKYFPDATAVNSVLRRVIMEMPKRVKRRKSRSVIAL